MSQIGPIKHPVDLDDLLATIRKHREEMKEVADKEIDRLKAVSKGLEHTLHQNYEEHRHRLKHDALMYKEYLSDHAKKEIESMKSIIEEHLVEEMVDFLKEVKHAESASIENIKTTFFPRDLALPKFSDGVHPPPWEMNEENKDKTFGWIEFQKLNAHLIIDEELVDAKKEICRATDTEIENEIKK